MEDPVRVGADAYSQRYTWGNLFVVVPKDSPDSEGMRAAVQELRQHVERHPQGCGLLVIVEPGSRMLERPIRKELGRAIRELDRHLRGLAILITATGFLHIVVPMAGLLMRYSSRSFPRNLTRTGEETAEWLAPHLSTPDAPVDAAALNVAIARVRQMSGGLSTPES